MVYRYWNKRGVIIVLIIFLVGGLFLSKELQKEIELKKLNETDKKRYEKQVQEYHTNKEYVLSSLLLLSAIGSLNDNDEDEIEWVKLLVLRNLSYKMLRLHAGKGDVESQFIYGFLYEYGIIHPQDTTKAVYWYQKAARQGYENAQVKLQEIGNDR